MPLFCGAGALQAHLTEFGLATRSEWLVVQIVGAASCLALSIVASWFAWQLIGRITPLRVTADAEHVGTNFSEHRLEEQGEA